MSAVTVIRKATPVLIADRIEPALAFWKKLGLTPTTEVPDASAGDGRLAEVASKLQGERLVMPQRTTFYGSTELGYADPAGNIVVFAEHRAAPH